MEYNNYNEVQSGYVRDYAQREAAFPAVMRKVYVWMTMAMVITGLTAFGVATNPAVLQALYTNQVVIWGLIIAEFALVFGISGMIQKISATTATLMFILYSVINGALLSSIFLIYTMTSIGNVFFITAGTFGVMAFIGYTTKKDLTSVGHILFMMLIGIIIATLVNMFVHSTGLQMIISYVGVAIFVGLTAYDSQKIKQMLLTQDSDSEAGQKLALLGALTLYLDFINLFLYLLRIFGSRRD